MIKVIDIPLNWTRRHRDATLLLVLALSCLVLGLGIQTNRDTANVAASQAKVAKGQAAAQKSQTAENTARIDTLFNERDQRRRALDESRYKAALAGCTRQNVARRGNNALVRILKEAFGPVQAAQKAGKPTTPLLKRLDAAIVKLTYLPITPCLKVIPNPALLDPAPKHQ